MSFLINRLSFMRLLSSRTLVLNLGRLTALAVALLVALSNLMPAAASDPAPELLQDINAGSGSGGHYDGAFFNEKYYFTANDGLNGYELWVYDGTNPASIVQDIYPGSNSGFPYSFAVANGKLYFRADDGINGSELWVYDGTNPASMVTDIYAGVSGSYPSGLTAFNNKLYFQAYDGINGSELWVYDGTNPASMVTDIYPGVNSGGPSYLVVFQDKLYFRASDPVNGSELWVYDGVNPASLAQDIYSGPSGSWPKYLTVFNNKLYFNADDGINGYELWSYDGTNASLAQDIRPGASNLHGDPVFLTVFRDTLYFSADDGTHGYELWSYDGTNLASMVQDIRPGSSGSQISQLTVFENRLYFSANDGTNGAELWVYDGTGATGFDLNSSGSSIEDMMGPNPYLRSTPLGLFFQATDGTTGFEIWRIAPATVVAAPAAAAPYTGPIPTNYSDRTLGVGDQVTVRGVRLNLVTSCTIDGVTAVMSNQSADSFTITIPNGITSGLKDLVMTGPAGKLTAQGALTIQQSSPAIINEASVSSKVNAGSSNGYVAVYAKGHKGKTLSWKIAGKWFKTTITSDFQVLQRKTEAVGLDVEVHLYINGEKQLRKQISTR
jgi:ELWxxDGT repeat protein